jgi:hypothetical protein
MYGKPAMTCFKYLVYLYGLEAIAKKFTTLTAIDQKKVSFHSLVVSWSPDTHVIGTEI